MNYDFNLIESEEELKEWSEQDRSLFVEGFLQYLRYHGLIDTDVV